VQNHGRAPPIQLTPAFIFTVPFSVTGEADMRIVPGHRIVTAVAITLIAAFALVRTAAADMPREGKYDVHSGCTSDSRVLSSIKDHTGGSYAATCLPDAAPDTMYHRTLFQCFGSWSSVSGTYEEHGVCEAIDSSGDKFFGVYARKNQEDGTWRVTAGTGKYQGVEMSGSFQVVAPMPPVPGRGANISRWWGTYKLKQ